MLTSRSASQDEQTSDEHPRPEIADNAKLSLVVVLDIEKRVRERWL